VQAAAVLHGCPIESVQSAWDLRSGLVTEPDATVEADAIRAAYADARG
jgi:hypothetical protein